MRVKPRVIGVKPWKINLATVTFRVLNASRQPIEGAKVDFEGVGLLGGNRLTLLSNKTDRLGEASTQIESGSRAAAITVQARVPASGGVPLELREVSEKIYVVGSVPARINFQ